MRRCKGNGARGEDGAVEEEDLVLGCWRRCAGSFGLVVGWRGSGCGELMKLLIDHGMAVECKAIRASYLNYGQKFLVVGEYSKLHRKDTPKFARTLYKRHSMWLIVTLTTVRYVMALLINSKLNPPTRKPNLFVNHRESTYILRPVRKWSIQCLLT